MDYTEINSKTIDRWVDGGWEWGQLISHDEYAAALEGRWDVKLTPTKFVPHEWFGELRGRSESSLRASAIVCCERAAC